MRRNIFIFILTVVYGIICVFIGWLAGVDNGFDTGYRVAYLEMDRLLRQGVKEKVNFYIQGLDIKFRSVKDDKTVSAYVKDKEF
ncbi:MAG: hypothetical protein M1510_00840 [Nitrospirae bacterium]|nr:hypothetical protein [Nitrospirota bacterium]